MLSPDKENGLEKVCRDAHDRASASGRPVLASYAFHLGAADLLPFAEGVGADGEFRVYWEHPSTDFALVGGGAALRCCARGEGRFREMAQKVEPLLASAISGGRANSGPYALGGFSFFDEVDDAEWPGFDAAQMVVPEWMILRRDGGVTAMINRMVGPEGKFQSTVAEFAELARKLVRLPTARVRDTRRTALAGLNRLLKQLQGADGRKQWLDMVARAIADIRAGSLSKVVLARTLDVLADKLRSPLPILKHLRKAYPDCFNFIINPGKGQVFLGATPEQLVRFDNGSVHLGALAGTMPRGASRKEDEVLARQMLESNKERSEHQIVVDGIIESIKGLGDIQSPPEPQVVKLDNLQHLYTPITLRSKTPVSVLSMIERLHPTPAVGGYPGPVALERIRKFENFERGWYAGPVGWMNARGEGEFVVALRACTLNGKRVRLFAGGGIVAGSDPEQEYLETQLKLKPILAAIADE